MGPRSASGAAQGNPDDHSRLEKLGGKTLGTSVGSRTRPKTPEQLDAQAEFSRTLIKLCSDHGIVLNLHNHTYEVENELHDLKGTLERIPDVKLGPDLNWLIRGGVDPVQFIHKYGDRIVFLHLRDQKADGKWSEAMGEGCTDFAAIGKALHEIQFAGHAVIELAHEWSFQPDPPLERQPEDEPGIRAEDAGVLKDRTRESRAGALPHRRKTAGGSQLSLDLMPLSGFNEAVRANADVREDHDASVAASALSHLIQGIGGTYGRCNRFGRDDSVACTKASGALRSIPARDRSTSDLPIGPAVCNLERISPMADNLSRRQFVQEGAVAAVALASGLASASIVQAGNPTNKDTSKILNYNPDMEYRRLGKTGLMVSAVAMGGHWKRVDTMVGNRPLRAGCRKTSTAPRFSATGPKWSTGASTRHQLRRRLRSRGDPRLLEGAQGPARPDVHRLFLVLPGVPRSRVAAAQEADAGARSRDEESRARARRPLANYPPGAEHPALRRRDRRSDGCAGLGTQDRPRRFTGISSHHRPHIKKMIEKYPDQLQVVLTPYTADTKVVTDESGLWASIKKHDVGWFGIKPFASNSLFKGDSFAQSPHAKEDNRLARLAIRYVLCNPSISAPIPGLISARQVDNVALAIKERRVLDHSEQAELKTAMERAWADLPADYHWLRDWEYI